MVDPFALGQNKNKGYQYIKNTHLILISSQFAHNQDLNYSMRCIIQHPNVPLEVPGTLVERLLCISTSERVLYTPLAGQNYFSGIKTSFSVFFHHKQKKRKKKGKRKK